MKKIVKFLGYDCVVELQKYRDNDRTAIKLTDMEDGAPVAIATVNIPDYPLKEDEVLIKDYSENTGIMKVLLDAKVIEFTGKYVESGFTSIPVCKLLI
jgi:hypothetical protein